MSPSSTRRQLLRTATALAISTTIAGCGQVTTSDTTTAKTTTSGTTTDPHALIAITRESYLAKAWTLPQDTFRFPKSDSVPLADLNKSVRREVS